MLKVEYDLQAQIDNQALQKTDCLYNELFANEYVDCDYEFLDLPSTSPYCHLVLKCVSSTIQNLHDKLCKKHLSHKKIKKYVKILIIC